MSVKERYKIWIEKLSESPAVIRELESLSPEEISDRFWRELEFGTGGLRGEIGMGTNRMNVYTVGKATQGLARYLLTGIEAPSVAIAYDTRNMSEEFAKHAAYVLCANGIKVHLYDSVRPTPMLSFAVRFLKADAGIVITASHNPKQYNGYKVYGADGGQITDGLAASVLAEIREINIFDDVKYISPEEAKNSGLLKFIGEDADNKYFEEINSLCLRRKMLSDYAKDLKILYSPLHGAGNLPVRRILNELGFTNTEVIKEQAQPDGNFSTVECPNPEDPAVFRLAVEYAKQINPDLIFATDPDCDRIGVICKKPDGSFEVLTGNQTGALLCDYILKTRKELDKLPANASVIKTIVTTGMADAICRKYNAGLTDVLTGFKYIGEKIGEWEQTHECEFIFGFEESYGYLAGGFVRDKDAVIASALIAEMALYYKQKGLTLYEALQLLYEEYGFYAEKLISISMPGQEGQQKIGAIITSLRNNHRDKIEDCAVFEDYKASIRLFCASGEKQDIDMPKSNVLKFIFEDGGWMALRPSGTEPKMKIYIGVKAADSIAAQKRIAELEETAGALSESPLEI
jgi:phosphoglucomutase